MERLELGSRATERSSLWRWALVIASAGVILRMLLAATTLGTNDMLTWQRFALTIDRIGVLGMYALPASARWNHPPLAGYTAQAALVMARGIDAPFSLVFRSLTVVAEGASLWMLWRFLRERGPKTALLGVTIYASSPAAILVSGFHGNFEPVVAALIMASAYLAERGRPFAAGLALGAAIDMKLIPVVLAPVLLAHQASDRRRLRTLVGLVAGLAPFFLTLALAPTGFAEHVFGYSPMLANWGLISVARLLAGIPATMVVHPGEMPLAEVLGRCLVAVSVICVSWLAWRNREREVAYFYALGLALFLVFVPGFGVQWTALIGPVLAASSWRWGALWGWLAGAFVGSVYLAFWTGSRVGLSWFTTELPPASAWVGFAAWSSLIVFAVASIARIQRRAAVA